MQPTGITHFSARMLAFLGALLLALFIFAPVALAAPTTAGDAQCIVQHWLAREATPLATALPQQVAGVTAYGNAAAPLYYAVALSPTGFVIVAGDDRIEPIIAFAPNGSYDPSTKNPLGAMVSRDLPNRMAQITALATASSPSAKTQNAVARAQQKWAALLGTVGLAETGLTTVSDIRVNPLTQTLWSQQTAGDLGSLACYNYYTPPYAPGNVNNYPSGCVATAMAQLMRYYQYPTTGIGTGSNTIYVNGNAESAQYRGGDGNGGAYQWANMPLTLTTAPRRHSSSRSVISVGMPGSRCKWNMGPTAPAPMTTSSPRS